MDVPVKVFFSFFLLLSAATGQLESELEFGHDENTREFIAEEHGDTRKIIKSEMDGHFSRFWEMMTKSLSKMEARQEALSANLSREFNENMGNLYVNLSKSFDEKLQRSESRLTGKLGTVNETLERNHQQLLRSLTNSTKVVEQTDIIQPPVQTEMEELSDASGTIEFRGGANSNVGRKIWVLRTNGGAISRDARFFLEENNLGMDGRLSLWGSNYADGNQHVWKGTQTDWQKERKSGGNLIVVTLTFSTSAAKKPSFRLKFNTTNSVSEFSFSSELLREEGRHTVSYPPNNTLNSSTKTIFAAVIAPPRSFGLLLKFMDLPGSPPNSCNNNFNVWFLEESSTGLPYKQLATSAYTRCGNAGDVSENLGNSSVAILHFWTVSANVGNGFRVVVQPN